MIIGTEADTVYLSERLRDDESFSVACKRLTAILDKHCISYQFLRATKDIWCRDYMPLQVDEERFVQFRYEPSYLKDHSELQSDPVLVHKENGVVAHFSDINLDGGNVVAWKDKVIITDKVFLENPEYSKLSQLVSEIEELLQAEVIIIPRLKYETTGHADGLLRFVDGNTLVGNDRSEEVVYWTKGMKKVLRDHNLNYIDLPGFEHKHKDYPFSALGCYVNFLEVQEVVVIPVFEMRGDYDQEVLEIMKSVFPERKLETINYNEVGVEGGLLNCSTWTMKAQAL